MKFNYSWGNAQRFARRRDGRRHLVATSHGLRAHCGRRPALWAVFRHRGHLVASIFGSSSHLINGPTNAISLVVFSALGFFNSGRAARRLPGHVPAGNHDWLYPDPDRDIQTRRLDALHLGVGRDRFHGRGRHFGGNNPTGQPDGLRDRGTGQQHVLYRIWLTLHGGHVNPRALGIGVGTIVLVILLRQLARKYRLPQFDMLMALIVAALVAAALAGLSQRSMERPVISVVGSVPRNLPMPHIPHIQFWWVKELSGSALAIAFLGLLEALAIAKSIANTTRQSLDYNRQCLAEGLANLTGGFFQCLPGSGSLTAPPLTFKPGL
jgi:sulfate permease, SulP family